VIVLYKKSVFIELQNQVSLTSKLVQHIDDFVELIADSMKQLFFNVYVS